MYKKHFFKVLIFLVLFLIAVNLNITWTLNGSYVGGHWLKFGFRPLKAYAASTSYVQNVDEDGDGNAETPYRYIKFSANDTWTVPNGINLVDVFILGAGGGSTGYSGGAGGYTATYKRQLTGWKDGSGISVTPGETISIIVGTGGSGTSAIYATAADGGCSEFKNSSYRANGGMGACSYQPGTVWLYPGSAYKDERSANGGSGAGGMNLYGDSLGGTNGGNGTAGRIGNTGGISDYGQAGSGQGHTTREFGESTGTLYAGAGSSIAWNNSIPGAGGGGSQGTNAPANMGGGASWGGGAGGSGLVIVRYPENSSPVISITTPTANQVFSSVQGYNKILISGTIKDADAGDVLQVHYRIDGSGGQPGTQIGSDIIADGTNQSFSYDIDVSTLPEGNHNLYVWVSDNNGGKSLETSIPFNIDNTAPATPIFAATPTTPTSGDVTVTITYSADSMVKQYKIGVTGTYQNYISPISVTSNDILYAKGQDAVGNWSDEGNYAVTNIVPPYLTGVTVKAGRTKVLISPEFSSTMLQYTASVDKITSSINIYPTVENNSDTTMKVNNIPVTNGSFVPIQVNPGDNYIYVTAASATGEDQRTYIIKVIRASSAYLANLTISNGTLSPAFSNVILSYTANVDYDISSISVTPTEEDSNASITVNDSPVASGEASTPINLNTGTNIITVKVTPVIGNSIIYTITVIRASSAYLTDLVISDGILSPLFSRNNYYYAANVNYDVASITVMSTLENDNAAVTINGMPVASGQTSDPIDLNVGTNIITVQVTPAVGNVITYIIDVTRASSPYMSGLSISRGTLNPTFSKNEFSYTTNVDYDATSITVTPTAEDANATITVDGRTVDSGQVSGSINLNVGINTITVQVTAPDGITTKTYTVNVTRTSSPYLANLFVSDGTLNPAFTKTNYSYMVDAGFAPAITLTPTAEDPNATVTVNGTPIANGQTSPPINLSAGVNTITVQVTPVIGNPVTYTITVTRQTSQYLSGLTMNSVILSPVFAKTQAAYMADVGYDISSITVIPTAEDSTSAIKVNGTVVPSGQTSGAINLKVGANPIVVEVTAADGTTKFTYTVTVTREGSQYLSGLDLSEIVLEQTFAGRTLFAYTASIANSVASTVVTPTMEDSTATVAITVNGTVLPNGQTMANLNVGTNTISVQVSAYGGIQQTYTMIVTRAQPAPAYLSNIVFSNNASFEAIFDQTQPAVDVNVLFDPPDTFTLTPRAVDAGATITINGTTTISSGQSWTATSPAAGQTSTITLKVSAPGKSDFTYTLTVLRATSPYLAAPGFVIKKPDGSSVTYAPTFSKTRTTPPNTPFNAGTVTGIDYITVTPSAEDPGATVTVNGTVVPNGQAYTYTFTTTGLVQINIAVSSRLGTDTKKYAFKITKANSLYLTNLTLSSGTLSPTFVKTNYAYTASVGFNTTSMTVTPTVEDPTSTITVNGVAGTNGQASAPINLNVGTNTITVLVTAQDGTTTKTYTVTINRAPSSNADLSALTLSNGTLTPAFASGTTTYAASVANSISSITVTPTVADSTATIKVNGTAVTSGQAFAPINLNVGINTISVQVTAPDGITTKTYTVNVTRAGSSYLANLSMSGGTLNPSFVKTNYNYTVDVGFAPAITLTPAAEDPNATVTVNGITVSYGQTSQPINLSVGVNTITVQVTPVIGSPATYIFAVTRQTSKYLSGLTVSSGTLSPQPFEGRTTFAYTASVGYDVTSIILTPAAEDAYATIKVNNVAVLSNQASAPIPLNVGSNTITIQVTGSDGSAQATYTVTVIRAGSQYLSGLTLSSGTLSPTFAGRTMFAYNASVGYDDGASITITPTAEYSGSTIKVNGNVVASGSAVPVNLNVGANTINIVVTDPVTGIQQTYTVTVTRNGSRYLSNLTISSGTLSFAKSTYTYNVSVGFDASSITVTPTAEDGVATITVNGATVASGTASGPISLNVGNSNTITIVVTAYGGTQQTYTITVARSGDAYLASITGLTLTPTFDKRVFTGYTSSVAGVTSVKITPTAEDSQATVTVNGTVVPAGQKATVPVNVGTNTITVVVTPVFGTPNTYIFTVTRTS